MAMCLYETIKPYKGSENWLETCRLKHVILNEVMSLVITRGGEAGCYVLTLPLLFLIPCRPFTLLPMRLPIPGTALP